MSRSSNGRDNAATLLGPVGVVMATGMLSLLFSESIQLKFLNALVITAMVVGLYVFAGNSGVISFGHVSFVGIGAFVAGIYSMEVQQKGAVFKDLFPFVKDHHLGNITTLILAAAVGGLFALIVGIPLVRLNGLSAGIATFAVLGITRNVLRNWSKIGPGAKAIPSVEESTGLTQALIAVTLCIAAAFAYQISPSGRRLRATREDAAAAQGVGVRIYRERLIAFTLSGAISGFAGAIYVHFLGSISTDQVYLDLTFLVLAMLVVGGVNSLWGAVIGGLTISLLNTLLTEGEQGMSVFGWSFTLPTSTSGIVLAIVMAVVLLARPLGLSNGREFRLPRRVSAE